MHANQGSACSTILQRRPRPFVVPACPAMGSRSNGRWCWPGKDIVNLFVEAECIAELEGGKSWRARSGWGRMAIIPLASPSLPRSTPGSDLVKWHGIPRHASGDVAAGNALKWDQRQKENVVRVWLI